MNRLTDAKLAQLDAFSALANSEMSNEQLYERGFEVFRACIELAKASPRLIAELRASRDAVDSLLEEVQRLRGPAELWAMVETLREHEGDTVQIVNDNPDFGGPNCIVGVTGAWTDWVERDIPGDNIRDCLEKAVAAKRHYEGAS